MKKIFLLTTILLGTLTLTACDVTIGNNNKFDHTVSVVSDENYGTITGAGKFKEGETVTLAVSMSEDFDLVGWYDGDNLLSDKTTYQFKMPDQNLEITLKAMIKISNLSEYVIDEANKLQVYDENANSTLVFYLQNHSQSKTQFLELLKVQNVNVKIIDYRLVSDDILSKLGIEHKNYYEIIGYDILSNTVKVLYRSTAYEDVNKISEKVSFTKAYGAYDIPFPQYKTILVASSQYINFGYSHAEYVTIENTTTLDVSMLLFTSNDAYTLNTSKFYMVAEKIVYQVLNPSNVVVTTGGTDGFQSFKLSFNAPLNLKSIVVYLEINDVSTYIHIAL